ncbi:MAG: FAD-dependent oxidoreductase [Eubacterium sp.]|nr:FAD-dependent oxidoreductase [Eubacterium sp.]
MEQLIIIGAGPAGISAALYAVRSNIVPLVINNGIGALEKAEKIENYYGLERPLSGAELYDRGIEQARALGVRFVDAQMLGVQGFAPFEVVTTEGRFETNCIIFATGNKRMRPNIKGVAEMEGKGVSYCAICDAFFYRGKDVAVIGNGDYALHEASELANVVGNVTIFTDGKEAAFSKETDIPVDTRKIQAVEGDELVSGIRIEGQEDPVPVSGVFIAVGTAGSADMARQMGAALTDKGNIKVNDKMATNIPGVYAAGDCTGGLLQVAKAVHDGAEAGLSAVQFIRNQK